MLVDFQDIIERAGSPDWRDGHGTPRYGEFHPEHVTIYNKTVGLFIVGCQDCTEQFRISCVYDDPPYMNAMFRKHAYGGPPDCEPKEDEEGWEAWREKMGAAVDPDNYYFGDPPAHGCIGDTMSSYSLACEQWWNREGVGDWGRDPAKEYVFDVEYRAWLERVGYHPEEDPEDILIHLKGAEEVEDVPLDYP